MEPDVREMLDAVADEPTPTFLYQLEAKLATLTDMELEPTVPVVEVPLVTAPGRGRWPRIWLVAATTLATVAAVAALAHRREGGSTTDPPPTAPATTATTTVPTQPSSTVVIPSTVATTVPVATTDTTVPSLPELSPSAFWLPKAPSPLPRRVMPVALAAGDDVVVFGGSASIGALDTARPDGARWTARTETWERLPDAPFGPVTAIWAGDRVIALGVSGQAASLVLGDASWTDLPPTGLSPRAGSAVAWTGSEVLVWGGWADPCGSGPCTALSDGASFDPATNTWRPLPIAAGLQPGGGAVWAGTRFVVGDGSAAQGRSSRPWRAFDPAARRWATIPAPPGPSALIASDGDRLEAADGSNGQLYTATLPDVRWVADGQVPSDGQTSVSWGAFTDGHLIVDTGSGTSGGRFVGYRESGGAWVAVGPGVMTNDDAPPVVADGTVVGTNGTALSVLRPIEDHTIGAPPCRADQLDTTVDTRLLLGRNLSIYLYNHSDSLCTVSGQRPLDVRFTLDGRAQPVLQTASPFLHQGEGVSGGAVAPGQWARIDLSPWLGPNGSTGCPADGSISAISFDLSSGDTLTVPLDGLNPPADQCWDLSSIAAVSTAELAPRCDGAVLGTNVTEVDNGQDGGFVITLTNNGATPCAVVGRPTLEADYGDGSWSVVAPPGPVPPQSDIASTLALGAKARLRTIGALPDANGATCVETAGAATATRWRLRLSNGWIVALQHDGLRHRCQHPMLSGFETTSR